jgi:hypothetical protein
MCMLPVLLAVVVCRVVGAALACGFTFRDMPGKGGDTPRIVVVKNARVSTIDPFCRELTVDHGEYSVRVMNKHFHKYQDRNDDFIGQ